MSRKNDFLSRDELNALRREVVALTAEDEEKKEENSLIDTRDEEVIDVELVDVYEEDIDAICDDYRLGMYDDMEEDVYDDEETINKYFYGG